MKFKMINNNSFNNMKHLVTSVIIVMALTLTCGCHRGGDTLKPFGWRKISSRVDSLTLEAERCYFGVISPDELSRTIALMDSSVVGLSKSQAREVKARNRFWRAYLMNMTGQREYALSELEMAADIADDQYTLNRINDLKQLISGYRTLETFKYLLRQLDHYKANDETVEEANTALMISNSLQYANVPELASRYLTLADSLYKTAGLDDRRINVKLNRATVLVFSNEGDDAEEKLNSFLEDSVIIGSPFTYESLLRSHYCFFRDSASLFKGYRVVTADLHPDSIARGLATMRGFYEALICQHYLNTDSRDSSAHYFDLSRRHINETDNPTYRSNAFEIYSRYYESVGNMAGELAELRHYKQAADSLKNMDDPQGKVTMEYINTLHNYELESGRERQELKFRFYFIIGVLVMIILLTVIVGGRYYQRQKIKALNASLESERKQRRILAMSIQQEESARLIDFVKEETARLSGNSNVEPRDLSRLETNVKLHLAEQGELTAFGEAFEELSPEFVEKLRDVAPELSANNIRICIYIHMGLSNHEIANRMHTSVGAVRVSRHRLRHKLGLAKDDTLEDFLKKLVQR